MRRGFGVAAAAALALSLGACAGSGSASGRLSRDGSSLTVTASTDQVTSVPRCTFAVTIRGEASAAQRSLIDCFAKAEYDRSLSELGRLALVDLTRVTLTRAHDLRFGQPARAGRVEAWVVPNAVDPASATARVRYVGGATVTLDLQLANPQSGQSWRLVIGREVPTVRPTSTPLST